MVICLSHGGGKRKLYYKKEAIKATKEKEEATKAS